MIDYQALQEATLKQVVRKSHECDELRAALKDLQKDQKMPDRKYARTSMKTLLDQYWSVLQESQLTDNSVKDYYYFAECFVRWCNGEFTPGRTLDGTE